jgi:hypothetical protein
MRQTLLLLTLVLALPIIILISNGSKRTNEDLVNNSSKIASFTKSSMTTDRQFNLSDSSQVTQFIKNAISITDTSLAFFLYEDVERCMSLINNYELCTLGEPVRQGVVNKCNIHLSWRKTTFENVKDFNLTIHHKDKFNNNEYFRVYFNILDDYSECYLQRSSNDSSICSQKIVASNFQEINLNLDTTGCVAALNTLVKGDSLYYSTNKSMSEVEKVIGISYTAFMLLGFYLLFLAMIRKKKDDNGCNC